MSKKPVVTTKVLDIRNLPKRVDHGLYIGRGSFWANPFVIGKDGTREQVLAKFKRHLWNRQDMMLKLHKLRGKSLICWCHPEGCHGDILVAALKWQDAEISRRLSKRKVLDLSPDSETERQLKLHDAAPAF